MIIIIPTTTTTATIIIIIIIITTTTTTTTTVTTTTNATIIIIIIIVIIIIIIIVIIIIIIIIIVIIICGRLVLDVELVVPDLLSLVMNDVSIVYPSNGAKTVDRVVVAMGNKGKSQATLRYHSNRLMTLDMQHECESEEELKPMGPPYTLELSCLNCGKINALRTSQRDTNPVASIPDRAPQMSTPVAADDNELSVDDNDEDEDGARGCKVVFQDQKEEQSLSTSSPGMNLRSRRRIEPPSHKSRRASKRKRPTSAQTNNHPGQTSVKSTSQNTSSEASEHSDDYFRPVAELSTAVKSEESSYQNVVKVEDATHGESQRDEETPRAGRGRPRKYPPIPLECSVCHRKLSTRMAVINHMKKKHPDTKLPESFDAVPPTPRKKPAERRGMVKRERDGGGGE
ncbi:hypothetical protein ACOMHN_066730 [Nucella lapillus]